MFRNFNKFKSTKYWNQNMHMGYGTFLPKPPQKPEDDLIMGLLLAGLGATCGWSMWTDKKDIYTQCEKNTRFLSTILTGVTLTGAAGYIVKYIRR